VDAMHLSKLNMLHLHLTDSQSFPILLNDVKISNPNTESIETLELSKLAQQGSFSNEKRYTKADLIDLVEYAYTRGIEIVPELDMPAHSLSWGNAFQDVVVNCTSTARATQTPWNIYPLDPSNEKLYKIIFHVLAQLVEVFPSRYLHVGGDEVSENCWQEDAKLMEWAKETQLSSKDITKYFEERVFSMVYRLGKVPIVWQGVLDSNSMPKERIYSNNSKLFEKYFKYKYSSSSKLWSLYGGNRSDAAALNGDDDKIMDESVKDFRSIVEPWKCWGGALVSIHIILLVEFQVFSMRTRTSNHICNLIHLNELNRLGLALRAATKAVENGHPVLMSACWYLDYDQDWTSYLATDILTSASLATAAHIRFEHSSYHLLRLATFSSL